MREALESVLVDCLAVLALGIVKLLNKANERLLAEGPMLGGRPHLGTLLAHNWFHLGEKT